MRKAATKRDIEGEIISILFEFISVAGKTNNMTFPLTANWGGKAPSRNP